MLHIKRSKFAASSSVYAMVNGAMPIDGKTLAVTNPATGEEIGSIAYMGAAREWQTRNRRRTSRMASMAQ